MSEPFLAEVRIVAFNFPPRGWAFCDGQLLPINQNQSLFSLLGTTYGGDGRTNFALPELRGRVPLHPGSSNGTTYAPGNRGGEETVSLSVAQMPAHDHGVKASNTADTDEPAGNFAGLTEDATYSAATNPTLAQLASGTVATAGIGQGHDNTQPYLVLNFCIALRGLFPSRN